MPFLLKIIIKNIAANGLPGLLPVGQVREESYLPEGEIYMSRTTERGFFGALLIKY